MLEQSFRIVCSSGGVNNHLWLCPWFAHMSDYIWRIQIEIWMFLLLLSSSGIVTVCKLVQRSIWQLFHSVNLSKCKLGSNPYQSFEETLLASFSIVQKYSFLIWVGGAIEVAKGRTMVGRATTGHPLAPPLFLEVDKIASFHCQNPSLCPNCNSYHLELSCSKIIICFSYPLQYLY